jgi:hypothetical protein
VYERSEAKRDGAHEEETTKDLARAKPVA